MDFWLHKIPASFKSAWVLFSYPQLNACVKICHVLYKKRVFKKIPKRGELCKKKKVLVRFMFSATWSDAWEPSSISSFITLNKHLQTFPDGRPEAWQWTDDPWMASTACDSSKPAETIWLPASLSSDTASGNEVCLEGGKASRSVGGVQRAQGLAEGPFKLQRPKIGHKTHASRRGKRRDHTNLIFLKRGKCTKWGGGGKLCVTPFLPGHPKISVSFPSTPPLMYRSD